MYRLMLIFLAGGCGCLLRYGLAGWVQRSCGGDLPVGTLAVNVLGCLVIGFAAALLTGPMLVREEYRLALLIGLLGGFTTFSSFGYETLMLARDGQWLVAVVNVLLSNAAGLLAAWTGDRLAVLLYGR